MKASAIAVLLSMSGLSVYVDHNDEPDQVDDEIKFHNYPSISIQVHPSGSYCCASLSGGEGKDFWIEELYDEFRPTQAKVLKMVEFLKDYIEKNLTK